MLPGGPQASLTVKPGGDYMPSGFPHHRGMLSVEKKLKNVMPG